jgi:hypothetical protein
MSVQALVIADAIGAAFIAMWLYVRFEDRSPDPLRTILHAACVFAVMVFLPWTTHFVAGGGDSLLRKFASNFVVVVPALTYIWLSSIWLFAVTMKPHIRF